MKTIIVTLIAGLAALIPAGPANAEDVRPCVTFREFWTTDYPLTKGQVERQWDIKGTLVAMDGRYREYRYPLCGHRHADITNDLEPHVSVIYSVRTRVNEYMEWV